MRTLCVLVCPDRHNKFCVIRLKIMKLAHHSRSVLVGVLAAGSLWANAAQSAPDSEPQKQQGNAESEQRDSGLESGEATLSELLIEAKAIEQRRSYTDSRLIMPNETLEKFGEASLGDALRRTPSIQMGDRPEKVGSCSSADSNRSIRRFCSMVSRCSERTVRGSLKLTGFQRNSSSRCK